MSVAGKFVHEGVPTCITHISTHVHVLYVSVHVFMYEHI